MKNIIVGVILIISALFQIPLGMRTKPKAEAPPIQAAQMLSIDPYGRVVDMVFEESLDLTAPWDRFRFSIDVVHPLTRDSGAFLTDVTGDQIPDLFLTSFGTDRLFYPGLPNSPWTFGDGIYLKHETSDPAQDPFAFSQGWWIGGDAADLDGDGKTDIIMGIDLFSNIGTSSEPKLRGEYLFSNHFGWDPSAAVGDLNGDDKPDVVITFNYIDETYIHWNNSTPGNFSFSEELLYEWPTATNNEHLSIGDINGDDLLDFVSPNGIYLNTGSQNVPEFDFSQSIPWTKSGGPEWISGTDGTPHVYLIDANDDGILDAYVSSLMSTVEQVFYYENIGTAENHNLVYKSQVLATSTPLNVFYRGQDTPNISGERPYLANADIDENQQPDILLSFSDDIIGRPTILWNMKDSQTNLNKISYQELYTYPALDKVDFNCGEFMVHLTDPLCYTPNAFAGWLDLDNDGDKDALISDPFGGFEEKMALYFAERTGLWPFDIAYRTEHEVINTQPTDNQAVAWGVNFVDIDLDGIEDIVGGNEDGELVYYRNSSPAGSLTLADPILLSDDKGNAISVGWQSWPTTIDLDGDNDLDFLVAKGTGLIYPVYCDEPGNVSGYRLGEPIGTLEQNPLDFTHVAGGGVLTPSITSVDWDKDGQVEVLIGDLSGRIWELKHEVTEEEPIFELSPFIISQTTAAYLEIIDSHRIRLRFALPTEIDLTQITYSQLPLENGNTLSGKVTISNKIEENRVFLPLVIR